MSFRVKEYHSRLDWEIGRGGFGKVFFGYRQAEADDQDDCDCKECSVDKQVAIKLEKVGGPQSYLFNEASVLKALQGVPGIPRFYVYSRAELPVRSSTPSRASTPSSTPRNSQNHGHYVKSPLSSPAASDSGSITAQHARGRSLDMTPLDSPVIKEPYYALVMQRLGRDIGSMFRKHISQLKLNSAAGKAHDVLEPSGHPACLKRQVSTRARPGHKRRGSSKSDGATRYGWDVNTVVWIGSHLLKALEDIHDKGYIHRDIKPENICIGAGKLRDMLYLIDFGMAKSYRTKSGAHLPKPSEQTLCVGTQAFMSHRCQNSRRDDLESWAYVMLYLHQGYLPWSTNAHKFEETFARSGNKWTQEAMSLNTSIQQHKQDFLASEGELGQLPREMRHIFQHLRELRHSTKPNYQYLEDQLQKWKQSNRPQYECRKPLTRVQSIQPVPEWKRKGYLVA